MYHLKLSQQWMLSCYALENLIIYCYCNQHMLCLLTASASGKKLAISRDNVTSFILQKTKHRIVNASQVA